jgi:hypothetical protein
MQNACINARRNYHNTATEQLMQINFAEALHGQSMQPLSGMLQIDSFGCIFNHVQA